MASNKDLMAEIATLSAQRGVAVPDGLDQLKNPKLLEILDGLKAPPPVVETPLRPLVAPLPEEEATGTDAAGVNASAENGVQPPPPPEPPPVVEAPVVPVARVPAKEPTGASGYFVAAGKTVSTLHRDMQGAFQEVYASDFIDGAAALESHVAAGYLFKR